jgi:hypothetical protein
VGKSHHIANDSAGLRLIHVYVSLADVLRRAVHHPSSQEQEQEDPRSDRIIDATERLWGPLASYQEAHLEPTGRGHRTRRIRLDLLLQDRSSQSAPSSKHIVSVFYRS